MHGTITRPAARPQLDPAWQPWIALQDVALAAAEGPAWESAVPQPVELQPDGARPHDAPLLHLAEVRVDGRRARRLIRELIRAAVDSAEGTGASLAKLGARRLDALALLRVAVMHDHAAVERVAMAAGVEASALAVVAQLAAMPLLHACARRWQEQIPPTWMRGYCPVCGAWPSFAELRGLERNRRMRCGRCASDWPLPVLHCPFCNEIHHNRLASLAPEGQEQTRRVDVCETCKGYVKGFTTLRPLTLRAVVIRDLESVELDLAAQERGYARPSRPGYEVTITMERMTPPVGQRGLRPRGDG